MEESIIQVTRLVLPFKIGDKTGSVTVWYDNDAKKIIKVEYMEV